MPELTVTDFRSVMNGQPTAEILSLLNGEVVRRLTVVGDQLEMDAITDKIMVGLNDPLTFEPWFMDRGSILFDTTATPDGKAKLCTQYDTIRFPDGSEYSITMEEKS